MIFVPGILIQILTFPGTIVHELAHQLFCRLYKVPVFKVVYFRAGNPAGYVLHERSSTPLQTIMISIGPFIVNTVIGALISLPSSMPVFELHNAGPIDYLLIYLGVSIAMHAFPSRGDAQNILDLTDSKETQRWIRILVYPIVGLIYVGSIGSFFWLDLLYGVGVALGLPHLIIACLK